MQLRILEQVDPQLAKADTSMAERAFLCNIWESVPTCAYAEVKLMQFHSLIAIRSRVLSWFREMRKSSNWNACEAVIMQLKS